MALNSTVFRVQYTANGATTAFSFPYLFLDESHLVVVETNATTGVDTTKALTTDYTVTGEGLAAGGTVTFLVAPANGRVITISRIVPLTQLTDYNQSDAFPADSHERALDKLTMIAQQLNAGGGDVDRSIRYPSTEAAGFIAELPAKVDRVNKVIGFDASGDLSIQDPTDFTIGPNDIELTNIEQIATDKLLGRSTAGTGNVELIDCTAAGRALIDDATAADQRTTLGLGTMAVETATDYLTKAGNLSGLADASTSRDNLGLGDVAVLDRIVSIRDSINQASHGFVAKDVLKFSAGVWAKAQADSAANSEAIGIVESSTDSDNFIIVYAGKLTVSGLTQNSEYFLSPSSAGAMTTTEPSTAGQVSRSLGKAISTTEFIVRIQQPGVLL